MIESKTIRDPFVADGQEDGTTMTKVVDGRAGLVVHDDLSVVRAINDSCPTKPLPIARERWV